MIGMAKACPGGGSLLNYIINERKGYELFRSNLCGNTSQELLEEFRISQELNQRTTNKVLSLVLSPSIEDTEKLNDQDLKGLTIEFLKELNINTENHQFLAFIHNEKQKHKHIHIYCSRIDLTGKALSDHFIGKKAQWAAHKIATKRGLISAKQIMVNKINSADDKELKTTKKEIFEKHQKAISMQLDSLDSYFDVMKSMGIIVQPSINKQGQIQGHRFLNVATNENFKTSEINRKINLKNFGEIQKIGEQTSKTKATKFRRND
ncbi:hypothetical protein KK2020170_23260 [Flavobacterium okayamense]|uniref:MobA/VirD2-like nuclease domain-containing protein n=2 Tax=Flavobacterium okayamense TaxID=2830782 RepID=A0ABN6HYJ4_9FLAO|nr:hypothetical protein KK2020170_23260 [Flavobacterium okayamense]